MLDYEDEGVYHKNDEIYDKLKRILNEYNSKVYSFYSEVWDEKGLPYEMAIQID